MQLNLKSLLQIRDWGCSICALNHDKSPLKVLSFLLPEDLWISTLPQPAHEPGQIKLHCCSVAPIWTCWRQGHKVGKLYRLTTIEIVTWTNYSKRILTPNAFQSLVPLSQIHCSQLVPHATPAQDSHPLLHATGVRRRHTAPRVAPRVTRAARSIAMDPPINGCQTPSSPEMGVENLGVSVIRCLDRQRSHVWITFTPGLVISFQLVYSWHRGILKGLWNMVRVHK